MGDSPQTLMPGRAGVVALAAIVAFGLFAGAARAQSARMHRIWGVHNPTVTMDDLDDMRRTLELSEVQDEIVESLISGYLDAFRSAKQMMDDERRAAQQEAYGKEGGDAAAWRAVAQELTAIKDRWTDQAIGLESALFDDVQRVLTPEQTTRWPEFERERRRRTTLTLNGQFGTERVDVFELVEGVPLTGVEQDAIANLLDAYAGELDGLLRARNALVEERYELIANDTRDLAVLQARDSEIAQRSWAIAELNQRWMERIAGELGTENAQRLRQAFLIAAYPSIFRETRAEAYINHVLGLADLTPEQRAAIEAIKSDYLAQLAPINQRLTQVEDENERERLEFKVSRGERRAPRPDRAERSTETRDLWNRRHALENSTIDRVFALLSAEQQMESPKNAVYQKSDGGADGATPTGNHGDF
ncbi:MAG: hypothetical protein ACF8PN_02135 [Phycisphaerales bacterium]